MPFPIGYLIAMQASGMVVDWLGKNEQIRMGKLGQQLEEAGIDANIEQSRLETEDASLEEMKQLRRTMGTQAAIFAARGTRANAGSAFASTQESIANFNTDERRRKTNQMGREAQLNAGKVMSKLHQQTTQNTTWGEFRQNVISKIPTSPSAWGRISEGFSAKNGYGFGLNKVGG